MTTETQPRFIAVSLTGYPINATERVRHEVTTWYVLDRAYCYRVVATYDRGSTSVRELRAKYLALELNEADA